MTTKAIFYDKEFGMLQRCMFAGVDNKGHAQWVNITPGEECYTLSELRKQDLFAGVKFELLCLEGEVAQSHDVARVLGCVLTNPVDEIDLSLRQCVRQLRELGVCWNNTPLSLKIQVFSNSGYKWRNGAYSLAIHETTSGILNLANIDGFDDAETPRHWAEVYVKVLQEEAGIGLELKIEKLKH